MADGPLLVARNLTKRYGSTIALESVDLQVHAGVTGLLGPNGAGKSTLIKLFLGLIAPTAGAAEVLGANPYDAVEARTRLGYMPEHDCLPSAITATEFLAHLAEVSGLPPHHARIRAAGHDAPALDRGADPSRGSGHPDSRGTAAPVCGLAAQVPTPHRRERVEFRAS